MNVTDESNIAGTADVILDELREGLGQIAVRVSDDPGMARCCRLIDQVLMLVHAPGRLGVVSWPTPSGERADVLAQWQTVPDGTKRARPVGAMLGENVLAEPSRALRTSVFSPTSDDEDTARLDFIADHVPLSAVDGFGNMTADAGTDTPPRIELRRMIDEARGRSVEDHPR